MVATEAANTEYAIPLPPPVPDKLVAEVLHAR
jgi:hypothetical protein